MKKHTKSYVDGRAQYWLGQANIAIENGKSEKRVSECERKAQYWLDRLNRIEGKS